MRFEWVGSAVSEADRSLSSRFFQRSRDPAAVSPWWGTPQMDDSVKAFIERQNIAHYIDQPKTETDPVQRDTLLKLLAEEEKKLIKASRTNSGNYR
jgi:hypothetical protein